MVSSGTGFLYLAVNRQGTIVYNLTIYAASHLPRNFPAGCGVGVVRTPSCGRAEIMYTPSDTAKRDLYNGQMDPLGGMILDATHKGSLARCASVFSHLVSFVK